MMKNSANFIVWTPIRTGVRTLAKTSGNKSIKLPWRSVVVVAAGSAIDVQQALQITESYFELHALEVQLRA